MFFKVTMMACFLVHSHFVFAIDDEKSSSPEISQSDQKSSSHTAVEYLQLMQNSYKTLNYEMIYLNSLQSQVDPKQLIHSVIGDQEVAYFRYLNGAMRESLQFSGKISYFEQGQQAYTIQSNLDRSVFANISNFNFADGQNSYEYIILGKGRIAGKQAIAVRMVSKDEYRYSYIVWLDVNSYLPLRLDTLNKANLILDQVMVVSLNITKTPNKWIEKLTKQKLPQLVHLPETSHQNRSQWKVNWLPVGFEVVKDDQHKLAMYENEPVSYIMLNDGIVSVSIYISTKKIALNEKQKVIQRGATVLYTYQKDAVEFNVVGEIPVITAKRLVESITKGEQ